MHVDDPAVLDGTAVGDADLAAARSDTLRILDHGLHDLEEGVSPEDRVSIDAAHEGGERRVETGVQGIRLAAVLLVQEDEARHISRRHRFIRIPNAAGGDHRFVPQFPTAETEGVLELLDRVVARAVVDDDDFVTWVVQVCQRPDTLHDGFLLVVGGDDDGDGRRRARVVEALQAANGFEAEKEAHLNPGNEQEEEIDGVVQDEIADDEDFEGPYRREHGIRPLCGATANAVASA